MKQTATTNIHQKYSHLQRVLGGKNSGASRRFASRHIHQRIRQLRAAGWKLEAIAADVGRHASTVSRVLSGKITSVLSVEETKGVPWAKVLAILREVSPRPPSLNNRHEKTKGYRLSQLITRVSPWDVFPVEALEAELTGHEIPEYMLTGGMDESWHTCPSYPVNPRAIGA